MLNVATYSFLGVFDPICVTIWNAVAENVHPYDRLDLEEMENVGNVAWLAAVNVRLVSLDNVVLGMTLARHRRNVAQLR